MGEVYRAHDRRLDRDVALKVLPDSFDADPDRVARFEREAKTLAAMNHPNIAQVFGLEALDGAEGGRAALVMELVDGQDLSALVEGGALPPDEALAIARQIADALEAAHEHGVIHRDLKPANIKIRGDGTVKVLDFGLAKALAPEAAGSAAGATMSPTLSLHATKAGIILGTAAYMAPEQARGKPVDRRADIWAFGAVLYEMLTGRRAFIGDDASLTLAAVMMSQPDWNAIPPAVPPTAVTLLRRCLEKDPKRRLRDIGEARVAIDDLISGRQNTDADKAPAPRPVDRRARTWIPWSIAALSAAAFVVALLVPRTGRAPAATPLRVNVSIGSDAVLTPTQGSPAALSRDGSTLAFVGRVENGAATQIFVRSLGQLRAIALPGTERASSPFFSPDGGSIAFFSTGTLKRVPAVGGAVATLSNAPEPDHGQGDWTDAGDILFTGTGGNLLRVPAAGGQPQTLIPLDKDEDFQRWPQLVGGGSAVLFSSGRWFTNWDDATIVAQRLPGGPRTALLKGGYAARYLPSGHLVYMHAGTLFAAPFDVRRLALTGPAVPVVEHIAANPIAGNATMAVSPSGTLAYREGATTGGGMPAPIWWTDKSGAMTLLRSAPSAWGTPRFSPDGRRIAFAVEAPHAPGRTMNASIWVYDWTRDTMTRLTTGDSADVMPVWTPDGAHIVFGSNRDKDVSNLYYVRSDGSGGVQRLTTSTLPQLPDSWHPNGKLLAYHEGSPSSDQKIMIMPVEGSDTDLWKPGAPQTFVGGKAIKASAQFSPDGRWISYASAEAGQIEVYVQPFPGPGGRWQISSGGGAANWWSHTKQELFFAPPTPVRRIFVVPYTVAGGTFNPGKPEPWSELRSTNTPMSVNYGWQADLHPDGERFAVAPAPDAAGSARADHLVLVSSFLDELRRVSK